MVLEVTALNTLAECKSLQPQWIKLVESMAYPSPFAHPDWILTALEANEQKWVPHFVQVKRNGKLVALLPLYRLKKYLVRELRYVGDCYYPDPLCLCCKSGDRRESIDAIRDYFSFYKDWDILRLYWLLSDEALEWGNNGAIVRSSSIAPFISLSGTFQDYLSVFKKKINFAIRKVKKFDKANGNYFSTQSPEKCRDLLDRLFVLHNQRSIERKIQSSFSGADIVDFHNSLIHDCNNLYFHWLTYENEIIAVLYGFLLQDCFFYYQISHDPKWGALSPGAVLLYKAIEECCRIGVKEFNFLQGDEGYKWKWTKESRTLYTVTIYNRTLAGAMSKQKEKAYSAVKKIVSILKK